MVQIKASGCCHTDLHAVRGDWSVKPKLPLVPGHEGVGIVAEVGEGVTNFKVGDHAGVPWLWGACGSCEFCNSGWETLCQSQNNSGYSVDGAYRQYTIAPASHAIPVPKTLSFDQAAPILCAGVTTYKALKETEAKPGNWVGIIGAAGGLGHVAVQYAKAMGYRVLGMDVGKGKTDYLKKLGCEATADVTHKNVVDEIKEITNGGVHANVVLAATPAAYQLGVNSVRRKGYVVGVSLPKDANFTVDILSLVLNRITIRGSIVGTREDMKEALDFAARGLVKCDVQTQPLERVNEVFDRMTRGEINGRVVFHVDK